MIFINYELSAHNKFACVQLGFQRTDVCSCRSLWQDQILRLFKPTESSAEACPSLWNMVASNSEQHCTSCVKLRISYPTETTGHAYKERFVFPFRVCPGAHGWFFHESSAKDHTLNTKCVCVYIRVYISTKSIKSMASCAALGILMPRHAEYSYRQKKVTAQSPAQCLQSLMPFPQLSVRLTCKIVWCTVLVSPMPTANMLLFLLETSPGVAEVTFVEKEPAERHTIISWEQVSIFMIILQWGQSECTAAHGECQMQ